MKSPGFAPVNPMLPMLRAALLLFARVTTFDPPALPMATWFHEREAGAAVT